MPTRALTLSRPRVEFQWFGYFRVNAPYNSSSAFGVAQRQHLFRLNPHHLNASHRVQSPPALAIEAQQDSHVER